MLNITMRLALPILVAFTLLLAAADSEQASAGNGGNCSPPAPVGIPDANASGVNDECTVTSSETISGLNVFLQIDHTFVGDLIVTLTHVDTGTAVIIIDRPGVPTTSVGCGGDNILVTLADSAGSPVETQCAAGTPTINGTFQPNNPLSAFNGQSLGGTWRLNVSDNEAKDFGSIVQWGLSIAGLDSDNDGCTDAAENQTAAGSEVSGGRRNPNNFWDFYDTPTGAGLTRDKNVSSLDIFQVIGRFNATGSPAIDPLSTPPAAPAYHTAYDRGSPVGDPWDLTAANGTISGTDIFGVIGQFNHSCA
jgi:subtilisin-like proprotein convertase family protein